MPVKKVTKKKRGNRIVPALKNAIEGTDYTELDYGDCFLYSGSLWMKEASLGGSTGEQTALNLGTGKYEEDFCGKYVIPVEITINWKRRK